MKHQSKLTSLALALLTLSTLSSQLSTLYAQGTAFTYQGRLNSGGNPANGSYDLQFSLYALNAGGVPLAGPVTNTAVSVTNGLFTTLVDFGNVFLGASNWLQIAVSTNGANSFTSLTPRQQVTPVPYAIFSASASSAATANSAATATSAGSATTANNFSGSLAGDVTGTQGATVVSTVGGATAANVASGANAANAATSTGTPNAIVKLDGTGSFSASNLTLGGSLYLPSPVGVYSGGNPFLFAANKNTALGNSALQALTSGSENTADGYRALYNNTSSSQNTAIGFQALFGNTSGSQNTAVGDQALQANSLGYLNTAVGASALVVNGAGYDNTAIGALALEDNTSGHDNTANGYQALALTQNGSGNTASGSQALLGNYTASGNTGYGYQALYNNSSGGTNIALGYLAGYNITGSSNIDIGHPGFASDNNIIRIGSGQTQAFIAGVINGNGGGLTNLNGSNITSGNVPLSQLPAVLITNTQSGVTLNNGTFSGSFTGNGGGLTNLNASNITSGTLADARLSANVALLNGNQTFTGQNYFAAGLSAATPVTVSNSAFAQAVTIQTVPAMPTAFALADTNGERGAFGLAENLGDYSTGASPGDVVLRATSNTNRLLLQTGALGPVLAVANGAVGLGTTHPRTPLDIVSADTDGIRMQLNATALTINSGAEYLKLFDHDGNTELGYLSGYNFTYSVPPGYFPQGLTLGAGQPNNGIAALLTMDSEGTWGLGSGGNEIYYEPVLRQLVMPRAHVVVGNNGDGMHIFEVCNQNSQPLAYCDGLTWVNGSDRNSKTNFTAINPAELLQKVAALPVSEWRYKSEGAAVRHIGPVAQDFHAAFDLNGNDDTHIATVDEGGVALAAIQGLNEKLEARSQKLEAENAELKARLEKLEQLINTRNGGEK